MLVVRANIEDTMMADFLTWYEAEHLPHVMAIPGIVKAWRTNCRRRGINWTALYEISDEASVQAVIGSTEADKARRDWERWLPYVADLSVEVYAPLAPLSGFHHWN
ncbi:MAG: hypothetical protein ABI559_08340 [Chloroflexota bacterium]